MAHTESVAAITGKELEKTGFDFGRIRWFSEPHVPTCFIEEVNNNDYLGTLPLLI